ncbi:hypothetical protein GGX14DRAFT_635519 [Mycena pura]|uniref:Uncharacterized protein n=1 Tax=Mycena pura TaxID=153505 RepID=A0AAD6VEP3_9AGAR|nr:hypothetical protein GGX14DRAFT_635519 [Mycena pura]
MLCLPISLFSTLMALHRTSLFSRRKPPTGAATMLTPQDILPIEMWESIFNWVIPDTPLPACAGPLQSSAFACIFSGSTAHTKLFHKPKFFFPPIFCEPSRSHFQSAPCPFSNCTVNRDPKIQQQFRSIHDIIARSRDLREITLSFGWDLFLPAPRTHKHVIRTLCWMLSQAAKRVRGPVFVVFPGQIFSCRSKDIAHWKLDHFQFNSPSRVRRLLSAPIRRKITDGDPMEGTTIRYHSGHIGTVTTLHAALRHLAFGFRK